MGNVSGFGLGSLNHMKIRQIILLSAVLWIRSTVSSSAQQLTLLNLTTNTIHDTSSVVFISPGCERFALTPALLGAWDTISAAGADWGMIDTNSDWQVTVTASGVAVEASGARTSDNVWPAFLAGTGIGILFFGFGWKLRLARRVADN